MAPLPVAEVQIGHILLGSVLLASAVIGGQGWDGEQQNQDPRDRIVVDS